MSCDLDRAFLTKAYDIAGMSSDKSTQNGAILVEGDRIVSSGFNAIYDPSVRPERLERPAKYVWTEHCERVALARAAKHGKKTDGTTLYCTWFSCAECARMCIWSGIKRAVYLRSMVERLAERPDWAESLATARRMFDEAGVDVYLVPGELGASVLFNGAETAV